MIKKLSAILPALFCLAMLQGVSQDVDIQKKYTAFDMRSNGKIYVVVTVVLIILLGLLAYLFRLDRKISRIERESKK
ncbi:MAG: CcmD family protein [Chitinophagales bacterium]